MHSSRVFTNIYVLYACDGNCDLAWGIFDRPTKKLSDNPDDVFYIGDEELMFKIAPDSNIIVDGEEQIHSSFLIAHNKWCIKQCERLVYAESDDRLGPGDVEDILRKRLMKKKFDLKNGYYNIPNKDEHKIINNIDDI